MNTTKPVTQEFIKRFIENHFKKGLTGPEILNLANGAGLMSPRTKKPLTMGIIYRLGSQMKLAGKSPAKRAPARVAASFKKKATPKLTKKIGKRKTKKK